MSGYNPYQGGYQNPYLPHGAPVYQQQGTPGRGGGPPPATYRPQPMVVMPTQRPSYQNQQYYQYPQYGQPHPQQQYMNPPPTHYQQPSPIPQQHQPQHFSPQTHSAPPPQNFNPRPQIPTQTPQQYAQPQRQGSIHSPMSQPQRVMHPQVVIPRSSQGSPAQTQAQQGSPRFAQDMRSPMMQHPPAPPQRPPVAKPLPSQRQVQVQIPIPGPSPQSKQGRQPSSGMSTPAPKPQAPRPTQIHPQVQIPRPSPQGKQGRQPQGSQATPVSKHPGQKSTPASSATSAEQKPQSPLPVDYQVLLLALAEEYIAAAHGMSATSARTQQRDDIDKYYDLISTGLGCIDAVSKNWKLDDPRMEARSRLRYAGLLHEDTDNDFEAEDALSRGITICERHRFLDLKYSMHHSLARLHAKSRPKAASKAIDKLLPELEGYQQTSWVYAFRFLRVSLSLQSPSSPELQAALQNLRSISTLAESHRHVAVVVASASLEAMVHLRTNTSESVELAQRALATARTHQLDPQMEQSPQLSAFIDCLDLACALVNHNPDQAMAKMQAMQRAMDAAGQNSNWREDGTLGLPVGQIATPELQLDCGGIFRTSSNGHRTLVFRWLKRSQLYASGYTLSGISSLPKAALDSKTDKYSSEGMKLSSKDDFSGEKAPQPLNTAVALADWRASMHRTMSLSLVFAQSARSEWPAANKTLQALRKALAEDSSGSSELLQTAATYMNGVLMQANGHSEAASGCFSSPTLALPSNSAKSTDSLNDFRLVATMNRILISRQSPAGHTEADASMSRIEPLCTSHADQSVLSAYYMLRVTSSSADMSMIKMKNFSQLAIKAAKRAANTQLIAITMNLMTSMFFEGIIGEQAEKSAKVGKTLSQRAKSSLWQVVAGGMLSSTLEKCGKHGEAVAVWNDAQMDMEKGWSETSKRKFEDTMDES